MRRFSQRLEPDPPPWPSRTEENRYMQLISSLLDYLGLNGVLQKYADFVSNLSLAKFF